MMYDGTHRPDLGPKSGRIIPPVPDPLYGPSPTDGSPASGRYSSAGEPGPASGRYQRPNDPGPVSGRHQAPSEPYPAAAAEAANRNASTLTLAVAPLQKDYIVRMRGEGCLTLRGKDPSADLLQQALGPACYGLRVVLDLSMIYRAETSGIAWLLRSTDAFARTGGKLVVYAVPPVVSSMFEILGLREGVNVTANEAEALAEVAAAAPPAPPQ